MKRESSCGSLSTSSSSSSNSCNSWNNPNPSEESQRASKIRRTRKVRKQETTSKTHNVNRRSSIYRGVTRHRLTGRYEAHLWDKNCWNAIQNKRGKQVYLGAYDNEEAAAHTYDLAALKYWGTDTALNFPIETYKKEIEEMQKVSKEEYLASLKRRSSGFSRGVSKYRGVARHHHNGRWEARIGRVFGNKYLYLGTFNTQEEAAAAYDMAAIEYRGANAVTNFHISNYIDHFRKKGIPMDTLLSPSEPPAATTTAVTESSEVEQSPEQSALPPEPEQEQSQPSDLMAMPDWSPLHSHHDDVSRTEMDELTWSFCLDSTGLTGPLSTVSDISMESTYKLPDLFQDSGFEDNIHLIFDDNCVTCGVEIATTEDKLLNSPSSSSTTLA